jgi:CRP-like cAMP-binding protein
MNDSQTFDETHLRRLSPLEGMKTASLSSLARKITLKELAANRELFRAGDSDRRTLWLISGRLELLESNRTIAILAGGSSETSTPLSPTLPRKFTARAIDPIKYVEIDSDLLDTLITWDQTGIYEVGELATQLGSPEEFDWMTTLLQSNIFQRIPPTNIQGIFMRMERVNCRAGEIIIQQETQGDYFYAIVSGKCAVIRETPLNRDGIRLADLGQGDTFGEEALISEAKRSATVKMLTDGALMRLNKRDFLELMKDPVQKWVDFREARKIIDSGGRWLDVRMPSECQKLAINAAINLPLCLIRAKLTALDRSTPYVVYCDTGRRSSAAAFILLQLGFEVSVLRGGLASCETALRRPM